MIWGFPRESMAGYRAQGGQDRDHRTPMAWQHRDHISDGHTHRSVRDCKPLKSDDREQKPYSILFDPLMVPVKSSPHHLNLQNVIVTLFSADTGSRPRPPDTAATPAPVRAPPPGTAWTGRPGAPGAPAGTSLSRASGPRARGHGPEVTPETGTRYTEAGQTEDTRGRAQLNWPSSAFIGTWIKFNSFKMLSPYWRSGTSPSSTDNTGTEDTTETDSHTVDTGDREGSEYHGQAQAQHMWVHRRDHTSDICSLSGLIPNILSLLSTQISCSLIWQMPGDAIQILSLVTSSTGEEKRKKMSCLAAWEIWFPAWEHLLLFPPLQRSLPCHFSKISTELHSTQTLSSRGWAWGDFTLGV